MVWYFIWPAPHPKYVHSPDTTTHFPFAGKSGISAKFFQDPYVPNGFIYWFTVLGREDLLPKLSFDIILGQKKFVKLFEIFTAKSEGKMDQKFFPDFSQFWA